jgi:hypothetical protein
MYDVQWLPALSKWVAVGFVNSLLWSADGATWQPVADVVGPPSLHQSFSLQALVWEASVGLLIVGDAGMIVQSNLQQSRWIQSVRDKLGYYQFLQAIAASPLPPPAARFVAVGNQLPPQGPLLYSLNGADWMYAGMREGPDALFDGVLYDPAVGYLAAGATTSPNGQALIIASLDGRNWSRAFSLPKGPRDTSLFAIAGGDGKFVAVGRTVIVGDGKKNWQQVTTLPSPLSDIRFLRKIAYWQKTFVAVGTDNAVWWSNDGAKWQSRAPTA